MSILRTCDSHGVRVCLSALLCWAWLQGNSRARRLRSAVPALAGFGFPLRLPAAPFAKAQTICSGPSEKRSSLAWRAAPFAPGRPNRSGHERKTTHMFRKNRITLIGFLGQDAESRSTPNGTVFTRLSLATQHELERERQQRLQDAHRMAPYRQLEQAGRLGGHPAERCLRGDRRRTPLSRLHSRGI